MLNLNITLEKYLERYNYRQKTGAKQQNGILLHAMDRKSTGKFGILNEISD